MTGDRVPGAAVLFVAWQLVASLAWAQPPAPPHTFVFANPASADNLLVLVNPNAWALEARVTLEDAPRARQTVRVFRLAATSQRTIRVGADIPLPPGETAPLTASVECLTEESHTACPNNEDILAVQLPASVARLRRPAAFPWTVGPSPWTVMTWIDSNLARLSLSGGTIPLPPDADGYGASYWPWTWSGSPFVSPAGFPDDHLAPSRDWYFAEGYTGVGPLRRRFATDFVIENPDESRQAQVEMTYFRVRGDPVKDTVAVAPHAQAVVRVNANAAMRDSAFSTKVSSRNGVPVVVRRVMQWGEQPDDPSGWSAADWVAASVTSGVREPATRWVFPSVTTGEELDNFILVCNPTARRMWLRLTFLLEDGSGTRFVLPARIAPMARFTFSPDVARTIVWKRPCALFVESVPADADDTPVPFVAEASVYWPRMYWAGGGTHQGVPWTGRVAQPPVVAPRPLDPAAKRRLELAPTVTVVAWLAAVLVFWKFGLTRRRPSSEPIGIVAATPGWALQARRGVIVAAAVLAVFWPTSVGGSISLMLNTLAILGTVAVFATAAALPGGLARRPVVVNSGIMMGLLLLASVFTPLTSYSPGAVFIYLGLALLLVLDLRTVRPAALGGAVFVALNVAIIALGLGTLFGVEAANDLLTNWYSYYRPELILEMLGEHKPVATFVTHSLAGFVFYLLCYAALLGARCQCKVGWWVVACFYLVLLFGLHSVTGNILLGLGLAQAGWQLGRQHLRLRLPLLAAVVLGVSSVVAWVWLSDVGIDVVVRQLFVGDRVHGFLVRFGADGLMQENIEHLRRNPLTPIGFGFSDRLYLGDCGILLTLLRGGIPVVVCVYGGLFAFFWSNIRNRGVAVWLWAVTTAFEVGFQPLLSFRFVALVPLYVVCVNALLESRPAGPSIAESARAGSRPAARTR